MSSRNIYLFSTALTKSKSRQKSIQLLKVEIWARIKAGSFWVKIKVICNSILNQMGLYLRKDKKKITKIEEIYSDNIKKGY